MNHNLIRPLVSFILYNLKKFRSFLCFCVSLSRMKPMPIINDAVLKQAVEYLSAKLRTQNMDWREKNSLPQTPKGFPLDQLLQIMGPGPHGLVQIVHPCILLFWTCCDNCDIWFPKTCCVSMASSAYWNLNSVSAWFCQRFDSHNVDSFSFHSYELAIHNSFGPLASIPGDDTVFHTLVPSNPRLTAVHKTPGRSA